MVEPGAQHHGRRGPDVRNGCACRLASIVFSRLYRELAELGKAGLRAKKSYHTGYDSPTRMHLWADNPGALVEFHSPPDESSAPNCAAPE
jgi:hypothetical protein